MTTKQSIRNELIKEYRKAYQGIIPFKDFLQIKIEQSFNTLKNDIFDDFNQNIDKIKENIKKAGY